MEHLPKNEFYTIVAGGVALAANAGFINVVSMSGTFSGKNYKNLNNLKN